MRLYGSGLLVSPPLLLSTLTSGFTDQGNGKCLLQPISVELPKGGRGGREGREGRGCEKIIQKREPRRGQTLSKHFVADLELWTSFCWDNCGGEEGRDQQIKLDVKHTHILRSFCIHQFVYLSLLFTILLLVKRVWRTSG